MSDGFLEMFGYSRKDIEERFHNQFVRMIYFILRPNSASVMKKVSLTGAESVQPHSLIMTEHIFGQWG